MEINQTDYGFSRAIPVPFALFSADGLVRIWNARMEKLTGYPSDSMVGRKVAEVLPALNQALQSIASKEQVSVSVPLSGIRKGSTNGAADALAVKMDPVCEEGGGITGIVAVVSCESEVFHGFEDIFNFIQSLSPDDMLYDMAAERIEERHQKMLQSEKLAGIGHLAAGVAHEINNPVGYIYSNLNTLKDYVADVVGVIDSLETIRAMAGDKERLQSYVDTLRRRSDLDFLRDDLVNVVSESLDGVERVKQIVKSLKDFSHIDDNEFCSYDIIEGLEATLKVANNEIKYKADVERQYGPVEAIECMPSQINQVILNLLVNAAQAMRERGRITLRAGSDGHGVWFEVEDTGCGIAEADIKRLFEPFYTTKPVGQGTGLGLSLSYSIVRKHGGDISVRSRPGEGTRFHVWLPARPGDVEKIA